MADGQVFGSVLSGATSGAGMGANVGGMLGPAGAGIGAGVGALAGGIMSGIQTNRAQQSQNIPVVDPMERARLSRLEQMSRSLSSGSDALTQQNIRNQQNIGRAAQNAISRSTGGDVGGTLDALLRSQKATQGGVNQAVAQAAQRLPYFDSAAGQMASRIAQRRLELDLLRRGQDLAASTRARTVANANTQALLATEGGTDTVAEGVENTASVLRQGINRMGEIFSSMRNRNSAPATVDPVGTTYPGVSALPQAASGIPSGNMPQGPVSPQMMNTAMMMMNPFIK